MRRVVALVQDAQSVIESLQAVPDLELFVGVNEQRNDILVEDIPERAEILIVVVDWRVEVLLDVVGGLECLFHENAVVSHTVVHLDLHLSDEHVVLGHVVEVFSKFLFDSA